MYSTVTSKFCMSLRMTMVESFRNKYENMQLFAVHELQLTPCHNNTK